MAYVTVKRPYQSEKQGAFQPYKETTTLFHPSGTDRSTAFPFAQRERRKQCSGFLHDTCHAPVLSARHV